MKTLIEPFRIKSIEHIEFTTREQRIQILETAHFNPFLIKAKDVIIDLLTDSGTGSMSSDQWADIMKGDESYAGSRSFYRFESVIRHISSMPHIFPVHQGRAAEKILFSVLGGKDKYVLSNTLFDTTRANIEYSGAEGVDLLCEEGRQIGVAAPFKGNIDIDALTKFIAVNGKERVAMVIMTVTNNSGGGQPVSMENIRNAKQICSMHNIPFFIDACRFAENCYFVKQREGGYHNKSILEIAQELFSYADGCTMSAKKDGLANIGGFLALRDEHTAEACRNLLIIMEGFPTYGGLAGRDLEAIATGLEEVMEEEYLSYRIGSMQYIGEKLDQYNIPYLKPTGGHAIYLDAKAFLPHIPVDQYPGQALNCALYIEAGIRVVEIGSLMFGKSDKSGALIPAANELVRLALPRRTYTKSHLDYVVEAIVNVYKNRQSVKGMVIKYESPYLRHFTARMELIKEATYIDALS
ncbi:MAG: tryptophanase [Mucilaginibacter sp.]|uniref:tryptophanase n=1 Tax=Mucilaginibacter sp. TaxID=1882438 RepID=UPI0031AE740E